MGHGNFLLAFTAAPPPAAGWSQWTPVWSETCSGPWYGYLRRIPYTAKSPLDIRKKADTKKSTKRKRNVNKCYMPLIASPCPGSFHEFEHSLADE